MTSTILSELQTNLYLEAEEKLLKIKDKVFKHLFENIGLVSELEVVQFILDKFKENNLTCDEHSPIVAFAEHTKHIHYFATKESSRVLQEHDEILIDIFARINDDDGIYYDITWCGCAGTPKDEFKELFDIAVKARDACLNKVIEHYKEDNSITGSQADIACRETIEAYNKSHLIKHTTGQSLFKEVHAEGPRIDCKKYNEQRELLENTCFTIEPGLYNDQMGVRTEISVLITNNSTIHCAQAQKELLTPSNLEQHL